MFRSNKVILYKTCLKVFSIKVHFKGNTSKFGVDIVLAMQIYFDCSHYSQSCFKKKQFQGFNELIMAVSFTLSINLVFLSYIFTDLPFLYNLWDVVGNKHALGSLNHIFFHQELCRFNTFKIIQVPFFSCRSYSPSINCTT